MKMQVGFRLDVGLIEKIDELARREMRNRSNMVEFALTEYVRSKFPGWEPRIEESGEEESKE